MKGRGYIVVLMTALLFGCGKQEQWDFLKRPLAEFDTLVCNSVLDVQLVQDTVNAIEIKAHPTLLKHMEVEETGGNLTLSNSFKGKFLMPRENKIYVVVHTNGLSKMIINQTCFIHTAKPLTGKEIGLVMASKLNEADLDLNCETFYYWNNFPCGGKIKLAGTAQSLKVWNVALMAVDAENLVTQVALIENRSKGDCKVNCQKQLTCKINGEGSVYVRGQPKSIDLKEKSGGGELIIEN